MAEAPAQTAGVFDSLEKDVVSSIEAVSQAVAVADEGVARVREDLQKIRAHVEELVGVGRGATNRAAGLASATEELATTARQITRSMETADEQVSDAVLRASDARRLLAELAKTTEEIVGIVDTVTAFARQTNLLALNATIEAARAGSAGRGFAVVASEVKALSIETATAASDIRERIARLRDRAIWSIGAVEEVSASIEQVQPVFHTVRDAVAEQNGSIADLAQRATETSAFVEQAAGLADQVDRVAMRAAERVDATGMAAAEAARAASGLGERFVTVMRQSEIGDRQRYDRFPVELAVTCMGGEPVRMQTIDLSLGGFLLGTAGNVQVSKGDRLELDIEQIGQVAAQVVGTSKLGLHCTFMELDRATQTRIQSVLAEIEAEYRPKIALAQHAAKQIEAMIEGAVADGRITRHELFDARYRQVPGTEPAQFEVTYTAFLEEALPAIQEALLKADPRMIFCVAVDRNGYVPVHVERPSAHRGRSGETVSVRLSKRILDDRVGMAAARSTRPFLVQAYHHDLGAGTPTKVHEINAPIRAFGQHWGGLRAVYRSELHSAVQPGEKTRG